MQESTTSDHHTFMNIHIATGNHMIFPLLYLHSLLAWRILLVLQEETGMHGPIEDNHVELMNAMAAVLDDVFKGYGFTLLVFDKDTTAEGRMNYICNCDRKDMIVAMKEFIANNEGRTPPTTETPH